MPPRVTLADLEWLAARINGTEPHDTPPLGAGARRERLTRWVDHMAQARREDAEVRRMVRQEGVRIPEARAAVRARETRA